MKVTQGATTNGGVWITFLVILAIYLSVGVTLVLVMRRMSWRWKAQEELDETDVPYGPSAFAVEPEEVKV
jgi:cytochrome d ubiquinol oxidase subunit I